MKARELITLLREAERLDPEADVTIVPSTGMPLDTAGFVAGEVRKDSSGSVLVPILRKLAPTAQ